MKNHARTVNQLLVVDEPGIERELLCEALAKETCLPVVTESSCQFALARALHISLLLLPLSISPQGESLFPFLEQWMTEVPEVPIVLLCSVATGDFCQKVMQLGIHGLVAKTERLDSLTMAIRRALNGERWYSPDLVQKCLVKPNGEINNTDRAHELKSRDIEIIHLVSKEKTLNEIAHSLYLSESTVRKRLGELYQKFNVKGHIGLVVHALKNGYLKDG